jgi:Tol biopolymer transport system component
MPARMPRSFLPLALLMTVALAAPTATPGAATGTAGEGTRRYTEHVSVNSAEMRANGQAAYASVSANGRYVAFSSYADNLATGDDRRNRDIFVRDRWAGTTSLVSVGLKGQIRQDSSLADISANGRIVAFNSEAAHLVRHDSNPGWDVFVRDLERGVTVLVSRASDETQANRDAYLGPSISPSGRYVAFLSFASNLVAGDDNGRPDVFVRDLRLGRTTRVSVPASGPEPDDKVAWPAVVANDGRVAFATERQLVSRDKDAGNDVYVRIPSSGFRLVSQTSDGGQPAGISHQPSISDNGRYIAFSSRAQLAPRDSNRISNVYVRDVHTGITTLVPGKRRLAYDPALSAGGRYVVAYKAHSFQGAYLSMVDRLTGEISPVSVNNSGEIADGTSVDADVSKAGRFVVFTTDSYNMGPSPNPAVFLRRLR